MPTLPTLFSAILMLLPAYGIAQVAHQMTNTKEPRTSAVCASAKQPVNESGFVPIGGIEQWVTIKGSSCANPVVLMLHGGPGNTLSPHAGAVYAGWERDFTLVQWDQRGAGVTYGKNRPSEDTALTLAQMRDDGVALAAYLAQHLGKRKIILMGGSWSSILGVHMIKARPDLFYAYVGSSHMVSYASNQPATYAAVISLARAAGDLDTVAKVEALGTPPWTNPRNFGVLRRAVRKYEAINTDPAPAFWAKRAPEYATPKALEDYEAGEDYSFLQFVGMKGNGMYSQVDLPALGTSFDVPFYMVQGAQDLLTMPKIARLYFDSISAPQKQFVLVQRAAHDPNQAMLDAQFTILKDRVRPLAK